MTNIVTENEDRDLGLAWDGKEWFCVPTKKVVSSTLASFFDPAWSPLVH